MNIGAVDRLDFIERYVGLLGDGDIALELHISIDDVRRLKNEFSQKCWTCKNACNGNNCSWVNTGVYPPYVDLSEDGRIVRCGKYEEDDARQFI